MNAPQNPKVALVHDWLTGMRGGEKVLEEIAALFPGAPIYTLFHFAGSLSPALEEHPIRTSWLQRLPHLEQRYRSYLPLFPGAIERFDLSSYDLVVSTSHCVAKGVRVPRGRHLCYCHTPVRYAWDQRAAYFPNDRPGVRQLRNLLLNRLQRWDRRTASRADAFAANSEFVRQRIRRFWQREAEVVHPPVDVGKFDLVSRAEEFSEVTEGAAPYLLSIAALSPYKRHDVAIRAAARAGWHLRIVGGGDARPGLERLVDRLRSAHAGVRVELLGRVGDEELRTLLRGARAFVQPGVEDFGIAAVEALASGVPVVAQAVGGVLDIVEHRRHGLLYGPAQAEDDRHVDDLAATLQQLKTSTFDRNDLRARAREFGIDVFRRAMVSFVERHVEPTVFRALDLSG